MRQTFFSLAQSPRPSVPYCWRGLLIGGRYRYLHRRAVLCSFVLHLLLKRAADDATSFFQSCPVSKALSFLIAGVTYL